MSIKGSIAHLHQLNRLKELKFTKYIYIYIKYSCRQMHIYNPWSEAGKVHLSLHFPNLPGFLDMTKEYTFFSFLPSAAQRGHTRGSRGTVAGQVMFSQVRVTPNQYVGSQTRAQ